MKNYKIKDFEKFLEITADFNTPLKFFEADASAIRAEANLRTMIVTHEALDSPAIRAALKDHGFTEVQILETRASVEL